ncbi:Outer membrane protein, multidrug efflux system [Gammaproteobacteria bacterium]
MVNKFGSSLVFFLLLTFISSCALYTNPKAPLLQTPTTFKNANKFTCTNLKDHWWQNFDDEELNRLVNLALQNNLNYQIALKNIQIARTYIMENASSLFPQANLNLGAARNAISKNALSDKYVNVTPLYNLYQLNGTVSYEADVWSRIRNSVKQAITNVKVSEADGDVIKLALISSVVDSYWQIVALNSNLANLKQQYNAASEIARLNQDQYKGGLVNVEPIANAKTQVENIKSNINNLEKQRQILLNTLAYLVGTYPENFDFNIGSTLPNSGANFTHMLPPKISSKMLINRPDIQSSFYTVISYGYAQKQSLSAFFPTFMLTGAYGFASLGLGNFTAGGSMLWNFGATAVQTLFDLGKTYCRYKRARLQYEAAVLTYKNTVVNAFMEVNNALASYQQDYLALKASHNVVRLAKEKLDLANAQYKSGVINYTTYLGYKLIFLQSKYTLTSQAQTLTSDVIQTYKTLGMGLSLDPVPKKTQLADTI